MSKTVSAILLVLLAGAAPAEEPGPYARRAREVTEHIQKNFFDPQSGVCFRSTTVRRPDYVWLQSVVRKTVSVLTPPFWRHPNR